MNIDDTLKALQCLKHLTFFIEPLQPIRGLDNWNWTHCTSSFYWNFCKLTLYQFCGHFQHTQIRRTLITIKFCPADHAHCPAHCPAPPLVWSRCSSAGFSPETSALYIVCCMVWLHCKVDEEGQRQVGQRQQSLIYNVYIFCY